MAEELPCFRPVKTYDIGQHPLSFSTLPFGTVNAQILCTNAIRAFLLPRRPAYRHLVLIKMESIQRLARFFHQVQPLMRLSRFRVYRHTTPIVSFFSFLFFLLSPFFLLVSSSSTLLLVIHLFLESGNFHIQWQDGNSLFRFVSTR